MSTYLNWRPNRLVSIGATCKHCGAAIHLRSEAQGWLHTSDERRDCRPTQAEPVDDPRVESR